MQKALQIGQHSNQPTGRGVIIGETKDQWQLESVNAKKYAIFPSEVLQCGSLDKLSCTQFFYREPLGFLQKRCKHLK